MKINYTETITDIRQISSTSNMEKHQQKMDNATTSNKKTSIAEKVRKHVW